MPDTLLRVNGASPGPVRLADGAAELTGGSPAIQRAQELVRRAAGAHGGVLITAPRGASPEPVARELHDRAAPPTAPFVAVECAAPDPEALERMLFGPSSNSVAADLESVSPDSRVAEARGGTLYLQNVSELSAASQARLAQIARDGEVRIDGAAVATHVRLVASATPGIDADVRAHRFRADLYRRLTTLRIDIPALADRAEDVPALADRLAGDICERRGVPRRTLTAAARALLAALTWPGNLSELHDVIDRAIAESSETTIQVEHLLPALRLDRAPIPFVPAGDLREARLRFERDYIAAVLQHHRWRMADAAQTLGIQRPNLYRKARQLGIPLARISE